MKAKVEHRVPLSKAALRILRTQKAAATNAYVFAGGKENAPLSNAAMLELLKGMAYVDKNGERVTTHGLRSSFRDWCAEHTDYPREIAEMALAHTIDSKVEAAYRRGDLLAKRRALMADWEKFCGTTKPAAKTSARRVKTATPAL
jgi:integrase